MDASPFPQVLVDANGQTLKKNAVWRAQMGEHEPAQLIHPVDWAVVCRHLNLPSAKLSVRARRDGLWQSARIRIAQQTPHFLLEWDWLPSEDGTTGELQYAEMLGGIVHSFNNYLSAMMGFAELAMLDLPPTHAVYGQLQTIVDSGQQATSFTRQLALAAGRAVLQKREVEWQDTSVALLEAQGINCLHLGDRVSVVLDANVLREALVLLIHYLKKYSTHPIQAEVSAMNISAEQATLLGIAPGRHAVLRLNQQGKGFNAEQCEKLFQPYFFNSLINDKKGLGLAPIFGLFRQMNGTLFVAADAAIGNSLYALLPTAQEQEYVQSTESPIDTMIWCVTEQPALAAIIQCLMPPSMFLATMSMEQAVNLLRAGFQPPAILSTSLADISNFRDIRAALGLPLLIWTPFADKRPVTEEGVIVLRADWSGETLRQALSLVMY